MAVSQLFTFDKIGERNLLLKAASCPRDVSDDIALAQGLENIRSAHL